MLESELSALDAQSQLPEVLDRVRGGEVIRIVEAGKSTVTLQSTGTAVHATHEERQAAISRIRELGRQVLPLGASTRSIRDAGRPGC